MWSQFVFFLCAHSLLSQVLGRFEQENGGHLVVATLSLLECSSNGLLETELLSILGNPDNAAILTGHKVRGHSLLTNNSLYIYVTGSAKMALKSYICILG